MKDDYTLVQYNSKSKRHKWIIPIGLAVLILILLILFSLKSCHQLIYSENDVFAGISDSVDTKDGHLPGMTREEIFEQMQQAADSSYFSFKIDARPVFISGTGNPGIENPSFNTYPMAVEIYLDSTDELLYASGLVYPDQYIDEITLERNIQAGEYPSTATIIAYSPDSGERLGHHLVELILQVQ